MATKRANIKSKWSDFVDESIRVFVDEKEGKKNGKKYIFRRCSTSVGRKVHDDNGDRYINAYFDVILSDRCGVSIDDLALGPNDLICSGFLSCREYTDKSGTTRVVPTVVVLDAEVEI